MMDAGNYDSKSAADNHTNKHANNRPRVVVSSDIGGDDPDDFQSMVHYLVYADLVETEALISSPPYAGRKRDILETLGKYAEDYDSLKTWGHYPTYQELVNRTFQGRIDVGAPGSEKETEGSDAIIDCALKDDPRPLYILVWGSITDLAQALFDHHPIKEKIRVYSIGTWNTRQDPESRDYIYKNHKDLWWIESDETMRGMYMGGVQEGDLGNASFVQEHVAGHGALGDFYVEKKPVIKMGDTPSFLYIISPIAAGVGNHDNPEEDSWGGRYKKDPHRPSYWTDDPDPELIENGKRGAKTVNRWREAYLRDWQQRMDRCNTVYGD